MKLFRTLFITAIIVLGIGASAVPQAGWAAVAACCCKYADGQSTGECSTTPLETNQTCPDVHGTGWRLVDDQLCVASAASSESSDENGTVFIPGVGLPGTQFEAGTEVPVTGTTLGEYIAALYMFFAGIIGSLGAVMVLWGGVQWMSAGGNTARVGEAKKTIYSALISMFIVFSAYVLLNTINPQLVQLRDLTDLITPVSKIQQRFDLSLKVSEDLLGDPTKIGMKQAYNAKACPSVDEMRAGGITVFLTGYYRPAWNEAGSYSSFACNVGMQCSCQRDKTQTCKAGSLTWSPCSTSWLQANRNTYCNSTASQTVPVDFFTTPSVLGGQTFTAAASECFGFGTTFTLSRPNENGKAFLPTTVWSVQDRGGDIKGLHFDLFTGTGREARAAALNLTGEATITFQKYCSRSGQCVDFTQ